MTYHLCPAAWELYHRWSAACEEKSPDKGRLFREFQKHRRECHSEPKCTPPIEQILDEAFPGSEVYKSLEILRNGQGNEVRIPVPPEPRLEMRGQEGEPPPLFYQVWEKREGRYVRIK